MSGQILKALPGGMPPPAMTLATPFNDIQLVALVAAQFPHRTPADAVHVAMQIVAEAIVGMEKKQIEVLLQAKRALRDSA